MRALRIAGLVTALVVVGASVRAYDKDAPFSSGDKSFREVRKLLATRGFDEVADEALWRGAVEGMLARSGHGKWNALLTPAEAAELQSDLAGEIVGVGVLIEFDEPSGIIDVRGVVPGAAAEKAGIAAGDKILKIDGRPLRGLVTRDVVAAMRGKPGTQVRLSVLRDGDVSEKTIARALVVWDPVTATTLAGGVRLITVRAFNQRTTAQLRAALQGASSSRALILDLRANPGGLLETMIESAGLLLPDGATIATLVKRGNTDDQRVAKGPPLVGKQPIVVLVDGETASSAEILAVALRDDVGARLVGQKTLGKWNAQEIFPLDNGYVVKMTIAVIKSPRGELLDGKGAAPDVPVDMPKDALEVNRRIVDPAARIASDPQLRAALALVGGT